jgi:hypothetical protein
MKGYMNGQEIEYGVMVPDGREDKFIVSMKRAVSDSWSCDRPIPVRGDLVTAKRRFFWMIFRTV